MKVHLIDGTYELFRHFFAVPSTSDDTGQEIGATRGVVNSVLMMLEAGATHVGVATDHVIESFRNDLYPYYKTGAGIDPPLLSQFPLIEHALEALGVKVWAMVDFEADDALAAAAVKAAADETVEQVIICTPDKDLGQCVVGDRIVQLDRRRNEIRNEQGIMEKFGVRPESIPDYLALVGDTADGYPGLTGWGPKAAAGLLERYGHIENFPKDCNQWPSSVRGAKRLGAVLQNNAKEVLLYRVLATLRTDVTVFDTIEDLRWKGPRPEFEDWCKRLRAPEMHRRVVALAEFRN